MKTIEINNGGTRMRWRLEGKRWRFDRDCDMDQCAGCGGDLVENAVVAPTSVTCDECKTVFRRVS